MRAPWAVVILGLAGCRLPSEAVPAHANCDYTSRCPGACLASSWGDQALKSPRCRLWVPFSQLREEYFGPTSTDELLLPGHARWLACAGEPSLFRWATEHPTSVAYRVQIRNSVVRVASDGGTAHLDAIDGDHCAPPDFPLVVSRDLTDAEWRDVASCWGPPTKWRRSGDYLPRSMPADVPPLLTEASSDGGHHFFLVWTSDISDEWRACAQKMLHMARIHNAYPG
jgi:hypothetical protein